MSLKVKQIILNMIVGFSLQFILMVVGFLFPNIFINMFGSDMNGFVSSINQLYAYLILIEGGVNAATLQALYNPIAHSNYGQANAVLSASKNFIKKVSKYYLLLVLGLSLIYPFTINIEMSMFSRIQVIFYTGLASYFRFYGFSTFTNLLKAEGKEYTASLFLNLNTLLIYLLKIILMLNGRGIIEVQGIGVLITLSQWGILKLFEKKYYKWINYNVKPNDEALSQSNSVLIHQVATLVFDNTDILLLTYFTNFTTVSIYSIYRLVLNGVRSIASQISTSFNFVIGHGIQGNLEIFQKRFDLYDLFFINLVFSMGLTMYFLLLPFMNIYTLSFVDSDLYIDSTLVILFSVQFVVLVSRVPASQLINSAGHFKKTQHHSIIEAVLNLIISLLLINYYSIYGILFGSIFATIYRTVIMIDYSNRNILKRDSRDSLLRWGLHLGFFIIIILIQQIFQILSIEATTSYISFVFIALAVIIISFIVNLMLDYLTYPKLLKNIYSTLKRRRI